MENRKIAIYTRVSSKDQALNGYGLDAQEEKCRQYLALYDYKEKASLYEEKGVSAKSLARPKMRELLKDVDEGRINLILIYKLDRLARSVIDTYKILNKLVEKGCQLISVVDQIDINSANGRMIIGILAVFAQWEREVIIERTNDGLIAMTEQGKYPYPNCPFGWSKDKNKYLSVNEKEAQLINYLGDLCVGGIPLIQLRSILKEEYNIDKNEETIKKWLVRDYNYGKFEFKGKVYSDVVPAIMTKEKNRRIKSAIHHHSRVDQDYFLFQDKVFCTCNEMCVQNTTVKHKTTTYYYYCCRKCKKRINQNVILDQILGRIIHHKRVVEKKEFDDEIDRKIRNIDLKIKKINKEYINDVIESEYYIHTMKNLQRERKKLDSKILSKKLGDSFDFYQADQSVKKAFIDDTVASLTVDLELKIVIDIEWK